MDITANGMWTTRRNVDSAAPQAAPRATDHPEIVFTDEASRYALSKAAARGRIRRDLPRDLYPLLDEPAMVVRRNLWAIVGRVSRSGHLRSLRAQPRPR